MGNVQAVIDLSEELYLSLSASGLTKEKIAGGSRKLLALKCFKEKVLSLGRASEFSGLSKWDFTEYLRDNDVSVRPSPLRQRQGRPCFVSIRWPPSIP